MRSFFLTCFFIVWVFFISACTGTSGSTDIITPAKKVIERQIGDRVNGISFQQIDPVNGKETFLAGVIMSVEPEVPVQLT